MGKEEMRQLLLLTRLQTAPWGSGLHPGSMAVLDWSMTVNGQTDIPDIFFIDSESSNGGGEYIEATINGCAWALIANNKNIEASSC